MALANKPTWVFPVWHRPPFNFCYGQGGDSSTEGVAGLYNKIADWVLNGHIHLYQRFKPVKYSRAIMPTYGNNDTDGVGYIVVPPAGQDPRDNLGSGYSTWLNYPATSTVMGEVGFTKIAINNRTIAINTYQMGDWSTYLTSRIVDTVSYTK